MAGLRGVDVAHSGTSPSYVCLVSSNSMRRIDGSGLQRPEYCVH